MARLLVVGGRRLRGNIKLSGSKNCALALIAGAVVANGESVLHNVPDIADVHALVDILRAMGVRSTWDRSDTLRIDAAEITSVWPPPELVKSLRASFSIVGPILARMGSMRISLPGGCNIGPRPVDFHLAALKRLGAEIQFDHQSINATCRQLRGASIRFPFPSVGATQHIMSTACLVGGITTIVNAAVEPEVCGLAAFLTSMGAKIHGAGSNVITIEGGGGLKGTEYVVPGDRIEAGTYAIAAGITGGDVTIRGIDPGQLNSFWLKMRETGIEVRMEADSIQISSSGRPKATDVTTGPYPGFPTDLQQPFGAILSIATGVSTITENVYEHRFRYVQELIRMGADIVLDANKAMFRGTDAMYGAPVVATDLRAGAALVCAGLAATGETEILQAEHVQRGYERIVEKLASVGAEIRLVPEHV